MSEAEGLRWGLTVASLIFSIFAMGHAIATRREAVAKARRRATTTAERLIAPIHFRLDLVEAIQIHGAGPRLAEDTAAGRGTG